MGDKELVIIYIYIYIYEWVINEVMNPPVLLVDYEVDDHGQADAHATHGHAHNQQSSHRGPREMRARDTLTLGSRDLVGPSEQWTSGTRGTVVNHYLVDGAIPTCRQGVVY